MNLTLTGTKVVQDNKTLMFENDNLTATINLTVDTTGYAYKLDMQMPKQQCSGEQLYNVLDFTAGAGSTYSVTVQNTMFPFSGKYVCQLRGIKNGQVYHSQTFEIWVKFSALPCNIWNPVPSEFYQVEANVDEINNHPPYPSEDGYWMIWSVTTKTYQKSTIPVSQISGAVMYSVAQTLSSEQKQQARSNIGAQETLVSGQNIKTVNGQNILGSGDLSAGLVDDVTINNVSIVEQKIAKIIYETGLGVDSGNAATVTAIRAFVNSSIEAVAAYYITSDVSGNAFATKSALDAGPWYYAGATRTPTRNDYAIVIADETHEGKTARYTYVKEDGASTGQWAFQYTFNMGFTQAQINAMNSGITETKVALYDAHITNTSNPHSVTKSQVGLSNVGNFKAVSTVANQGLTNTEKNDARDNIGVTELLAEKVKIQQGAENAGKVLGVTNDGTVAPVDDSGGILPILVVTAATGSTVTISRNGTTLTATEASGTWTFNPTSLGVWTITVVNDGGTVTSSIDIKTVKEYAIQVFNSPVYGIRRQLASSSPAWERTDNAIGLTFTPTIGTETGSSGFDTVAPWKDIHRTTIGTDVMVEIPNFYVKRYQEDGYEYIKVCATQNSGFVPAVSYSGGTPDKFYVGAYKTVSGHASKSGYNPLTNLTRASFRSGATGKGGGWSLIDAQVVSAVNILMLVETASYNSQSVIGRGYCDGHSAAIATGSCDGIVSGRPDGTDGSTDIVYRYIEGWWGNVWEWFDGLNWQDGKYYFCNTRTSYADNTSADYVQLGFNGQTNWSSSYLKTFGCDANYPTVMLPNAVGASDSTFSCDGSWSSAGWRVVLRGGDWDYGSLDGAFAFYAYYDSSVASASLGSRLLYISP